ncbi:hypothetical protein [Streptomyces sp. NPDC008125]|uniref:hypothetical protein n=1 Tax=Streptomyces sp. NPDC008125 TaxID=3364811 RepID=UPI0036E26ADF
MKTGQARAAAIDWVHRHARPQPGYRGAYFSGSTVGMADGTELPPTSDVDVHIATTADSRPVPAGKIRHQGALLEISYVPWAELSTAEAVLGSYHLAGCFRTDTLIDDPTGRLRTLLAEVAPLHATAPWVRRRCEDARRRVENRLAAIDASAPFHEQVLGWLFPTGVTCHVLLAAALRNPTIRLRYPAARAVLADYGHLGAYPELLGLLGCADLPAERVQHHLDALARTFDATARVARTPYFFSSDLTPEARPIAIDGSQALIDAGDHREAVFWIIATFARCHTVLAADAPHLADARFPAFRAAVAELLGIESGTDLLRRAAGTVRYLPRLWRTAEAVMAANPEITR